MYNRNLLSETVEENLKIKTKSSMKIHNNYLRLPHIVAVFCDVLPLNSFKELY